MNVAADYDVLYKSVFLCWNEMKWSVSSYIDTWDTDTDLVFHFPAYILGLFQFIAGQNKPNNKLDWDSDNVCCCRKKGKLQALVMAYTDLDQENMYSVNKPYQKSWDIRTVQNNV